MEIVDTKQRYGIISRTFHWVMALMMVILWTVGVLLANHIIPQESRGEVMGTHKSIGILILCIAILRVLWRILNKRSPSGEKFPLFSRILYTINTYLFYGLMFIFPLSGIAMTLASGRSLAIFGTTIISSLPKDLLSPMVGKYAHQTHEICGYLFIVALFLHIAGAVFHTFFLKDNLLGRMWGK